LGIEHAPDDVVLSAAVEHRRVLVTRDGDFARMLSVSHGLQPSILLLRSQQHDRPVDQAPLLVAALTEHADALRKGAIVAVDEDGVRVRLLPLDER
jgi:predicted nuclease of predicted toxin-antitoxin system